MPAWARECLDRRRAEGRRFAAVAIYSDDKRGAMVFAVDLEKGSGFQAFNADGRCLGHALADLAHRAAAERVPCTDPGCFACAR